MTVICQCGREIKVPGKGMTRHCSCGWECYSRPVQHDNQGRTTFYKVILSKEGEEEMALFPPTKAEEIEKE